MLMLETLFGACIHREMPVLEPFLDPIYDWRRPKSPPKNSSPVTSTNMGISPQIFLTYSFNPFAAMV